MDSEPNKLAHTLLYKRSIYLGHVDVEQIFICLAV